ncbi:hypothetical protein, partial [Klebsiella pneumoniae]|uniref:hypothetical protein n=1 Tax=Klebsiella pneumoniae TaxID=573 RepID=UPI00256F1E76
GETEIASPRGTVGIKLSDKILGMIRTDNRQDVSRWIRYAKTATISQQSKYLNSVLFNAGVRNHIMIALDTEDLFHPQQ